MAGSKKFLLSYPCPIEDKDRATKLIARLFEKIMEGNKLAQPNKTASIRETSAYLGELSVLKDAILTEIGDNSPFPTLSFSSPTAPFKHFKFTKNIAFRAV